MSMNSVPGGCSLPGMMSQPGEVPKEDPSIRQPKIKGKTMDRSLKGMERTKS